MDNDRMVIPLAQLVPALRNALLVCSSVNSCYPDLQGIHLSEYGGVLRIMCSDNYRLLIQDFPNIDYNHESQFICTENAKTMLASAKSVPKYPQDQQGVINRVNDWTSFFVGSYTIAITKLEDKFPDFAPMLNFPKVVQPEVISFDARFLGDATKFINIDKEATTNNRPPVVYNNYGNGHPSLFTIGANLQYFLMPKKGPNIAV